MPALSTPAKRPPNESAAGPEPYDGLHYLLHQTRHDAPLVLSRTAGIIRVASQLGPTATWRMTKVTNRYEATDIVESQSKDTRREETPRERTGMKRRDELIRNRFEERQQPKYKQNASRTQILGEAAKSLSEGIDSRNNRTRRRATEKTGIQGQRRWGRKQACGVTTQCGR